MKIQWIGGPTFLLELGSFRILSDPMFADGPGANEFSTIRAPNLRYDGIRRCCGKEFRHADCVL